jgi:hypothetical protein
LLLSRPEVGSSRMIKAGSETIYIAMHNLFFSPPEIPFLSWPPTYVFAHFCNSNSEISCSTLSIAVTGSLILRSAANYSVSKW